MSDIALPNSGVPELPHAERLLSDDLLAKLTGRGSGRAFAALYERHHQAIYRYCRSILRNDHDAQDALQSTMMHAYAALCVRERDLAVRPWLFRIAHNEAISITRKRGPRETLEEDVEHPVGVEQTVEIGQRLARLVSDMRELSERQRAALVMRELSGLSIEEIAVALDISQGAAKQTLFEARSSLHELAEGREMDCELVRKAISRRDGRVLRSRRIGAHLRDCEECRAFRTAIDVRGADLRALAPPLPAVTASAMLGQLLAHGGGHASGAAASGATLAGGHAAGSLLAKGLVGVAVMAAAAGTVKLTVERHAGAAGHSRSHRTTTHMRGPAASSPNAVEASQRPAATGSRHIQTGGSGGAGAESTPTPSATTQGVFATPPGQATLGGHGKGKATHAGSTGGAAHGRAHHTTGKPPSHHPHGRPAKPGSQHAATHPTNGAEGHGPQSKATHGQSGTAGSGSHGATTTPTGSHASQREASDSEKAGHTSEAAQGPPQPPR
jgi:RNA polymerase sigma factor (sigma-70 family)